MEVTQNMKENFYKPLCLDGYLTPLQRKKLREKRDWPFADSADSEKTFESKKQRPIKRKKEHSRIKSKEPFKRKKMKEISPQVQCSASKIVLRTLNNGGNNNKFFKDSSQNRLKKASFTMPLVYKKKEFLKVEKYVEALSWSRKQLLKNMVNSEPSSDIVESNKLLLVSEDSKKILNDNCETPDISEDRYTAKESSDHVSCISQKEKSLFDFDWPEDDLLLERQEKARALLRMQKDLQNVRDQDKEEEPKVAERKLYPIFYANTKKQTKDKQEIKSKIKNVQRKVCIEDSKAGGEQLIIDAGQREIGAKICPTCNMVYTVGQAEDERLHSAYHDTYLISLKFTGWKEENVIGEYSDGRIILVRKNDKSAKLKKIEDILMIANRDLGFPSSSLMPDKPDLTFVLFVSNCKQVAGCLIAEPIEFACRVLLDERPTTAESEAECGVGRWCASSESVPAMCGVNRVWVAHAFRRRKIASRMLDCLRCHFVHGHRVGIREFAFTDPTPEGRRFAAAYAGTDNFLVYK